MRDPNGVPFISCTKVDLPNIVDISLEMPPKISDRHRISLSVETTDKTQLISRILHNTTTVLTQKHLKHSHMLVCTPRKSILQKIARLQLFPVCCIQNGQKVRKLCQNFSSAHFSQLFGRTRKHEPQNKVFVEYINKIMEVTPRRLSPTSKLIAQLYKWCFPAQTSQEKEHSFFQMKLAIILVAISRLRRFFLDDLSKVDIDE
jgi:hypothetical protein